MKTIIIAEAGVNHNGNMDTAKKLIDLAAECGANYVKFQIFKADLLTTSEAEKANYQKKYSVEENQQDMLRKLELPFEHFKTLREYSESIGIGFLASAFDEVSLEYLLSLKLDFIKIPSGEITNVPYLKRIALEPNKIILSTGMSSIDEIQAAINILTGQRNIALEDITILHCNTDYPTEIDQVNLNAMTTIKNTFGSKVGYSDHTADNNVAVGAVCMGASIIEKHITTDKNQVGPDHKASMDRDDFTKYVKSIREAEIFLGKPLKMPTESELQNINHARRYLVASKNIIKGEAFTEENMTSKRTSSGIPVSQWDEIIGSKADKNFLVDDVITISQPMENNKRNEK